MPSSKSERTRLYLVIGLAVIFCMVGYYRFFSHKSPQGTGAAPAPSIPGAAPAPQVARLQPGANPNTTDVQGPERPAQPVEVVVRDIFEPGKSVRIADAAVKAGDKPRALTPLLLNGMIYSERNPLAIINGQFQRVGDQVGEYKIVRIGANEVLLKAEDREITLRIVDHGQK